MSAGVRRRAIAAVLLATGLLSLAAAVPAGAATSAPPMIRHVFVIVLENESASTTFGPGSPAPYLSQTLRSQGAYIPNYYGIGHESNDNYIAMISGQAPNPQNQGDCQFYGDFTPGTMGPNGQAVGSGCVFPATVPTIASQLSGAGYTWRDYNESMGNDPAREASVCGHPALNTADGTQKATATDSYATRHNPFVYFHAITDNTTLCDSNVVNLNQLPQDLSSIGKTANYSFITPDLCDDGHDSPCANGQPGGLAQADKFLRTWVPQITGSPAFQHDGLLLIAFDEAATSDTTSCCGEIPGPNSPSPGINGPGGGDVGAVALSPCIAAGTVTQTAYNHYSMLGSVENLFGLSHIGYAGLAGESYFGSDIFTRSCGGKPGPAPPTLRAPPLASQSSTGPRIPLRWSDRTRGVSYTVQALVLGARHSHWRTLARRTRARRRTFRAALGHSYEFRVRATDAAGRASGWTLALTAVPTGVRVPGGRFSRGWSVRVLRGAWQRQVIETRRPGAAFTLRYRGGGVALIAATGPHAGVLRVLLDGRSRLVRLHSARARRRATVFSAPAGFGTHRLRVLDVRGLVGLEGVAVTQRPR